MDIRPLLHTGVCNSNASCQLLQETTYISMVFLEYCVWNEKTTDSVGGINFSVFSSLNKYFALSEISTS